MGLGSFGGGAGAARYLAASGARVLATDLRAEAELSASLEALRGIDVELRLGRHEEADFAAADVVVANPAVRPDHPLLARARAAGARVTTEIELVLEALDARIACVTGTQGKSTTCHVLAQLLAATGTPTRAGGNLGGSLLSSLDEIGPEEVVVLELSSYQLEALRDPAGLGARVEAVAITNVLEDHLDRHGGVDGYARAKARILELVAGGGSAVLPRDDARFSAWRPARGRRLDFAPGAGLDRPLGPDELTHDGRAFRLGDEALGRVADLHLSGGFQRDNVAIALGLARLLGAPPGGLAAALPRLAGLPHRLEDLGLRGGRRVRDNAVSTTPDSTLAALESLEPGLTWIAGGRSKGLAWTPLLPAARARVRQAIAFGEAAPEIVAALAAQGVRAHAVATVEDAVRLAWELAPAGTDVLFSPACASFDAFPNFLARARAFRAALPPLDPAGAAPVPGRSAP